jgi:FMN phosphatase YigB (HAD superfamily)
MGAARAIFFDVAHTLLEKPAVMPSLVQALQRHGVHVPRDELQARHRLLMEAIIFPDRTSREFYADFNAALLRSIGALPTPALLDDMFSSCSYLPWAPFADASALERLPLPLGILSNWDDSLPQKLGEHFKVRFEWILGSAAQGVRKPSADFYRLVLEHTGLDAGDIVYVGDSMRLDIEPALNLGFRAVLLDRENLFPHSSLTRITALDQLEAVL